MRLIGNQTIALENEQDILLVLDTLRSRLLAEVRAAHVELLIHRVAPDPEKLFFQIVQWLSLIRFLRDLSKSARKTFDRVATSLDECEHMIQRLTPLLGEEEVPDGDA